MICPLFLAAEISRREYDIHSEDGTGIHCREQNCEWYDEDGVGACSMLRIMGALQIIAGTLTSSITIRNGDL